MYDSESEAPFRSGDSGVVLLAGLRTGRGGEIAPCDGGSFVGEAATVSGSRAGAQQRGRVGDYHHTSPEYANREFDPVIETWLLSLSVTLMHPNKVSKQVSPRSQKMVELVVRQLTEAGLMEHCHQRLHKFLYERWNIEDVSIIVSISSC